MLGTKVVRTLRSSAKQCVTVPFQNFDMTHETCGGAEKKLASKSANYKEMEAGRRVCSKKKDAEHSASQKALLEIKGLTEEQLQEVPPELSEEEKWQNLRSRLEVTFKDEVIKSYCPLKSHFAAAVRRGDKHGAVPLGVLCALDLRLLSACKALDPLCAFQLDRAAALVCTAATAAPVEEESVVLLLRHIS
eukprot:jgi/Mesen1/9802/ME000007S09862